MGGPCRSPRQPAGWVKGKQGCVPFTWWARWGSGGCWHVDEPHHSKLFSQHQLGQLRPSLQLPEASLSHCPAPRLATPFPCSPIHPSLGKRGGGRSLKGSDAPPIPDAVPHPPLQPQDGRPSSLPPGLERKAEGSSRSQVFTLGSSPLPPPKGQAGPHSAGR